MQLFKMQNCETNLVFGVNKKQLDYFFAAFLMLYTFGNAIGYLNRIDSDHITLKSILSTNCTNCIDTIFTFTTNPLSYYQRVQHSKKTKQKQTSSNWSQWLSRKLYLFSYRKVFFAKEREINLQLGLEKVFSSSSFLCSV